MKKSIIGGTLLSVAALTSVSASAFFPGDIERSEICVSVYEDDKGNKYLGNCDETANNAELGKELGENGCAEDQAKMTFMGPSPIYACLPPGVVQL